MAKTNWTRVFGANPFETEVNVIESYHRGHMPIKKLSKTKDKYGFSICLGVELEVDSFRNDDLKHKAALEVFRLMNGKQNQKCKIERDGSLNNGFEIITNPAPLGYHLNSVPWMEVLNTVTRFGGSSHDSGNCGIHVHVERYSDQFAKNLWNLVNRVYVDELDVFSRRRNYRYCTFERNTNYEHRNRAKYVALNTNTSSGRTVEFRLFRGTTKYETLMETLRLVERLSQIALTYDDVLTADLPKFTNLLSNYGKQYYKAQVERRGR